MYFIPREAAAAAHLSGLNLAGLNVVFKVFLGLHIFKVAFSHSFLRAALAQAGNLQGPASSPPPLA